MKAIVKHVVALLVVGSLGLLGCAQTLEDLALDGQNAKPGEQVFSGGKEDAWDFLNDPSRFDGQLVFEVERLPRSGRAQQIAWPSSYWPTYEDSINVRWNREDELSPAEKYDRVFNGWTPSSNFMSLRPWRSNRCGPTTWDKEYYNEIGPLARHISMNMGNRRVRDGIDNDNDGFTDECEDYDGVETWWGLCHAWVPAAILEESPERAVTYNGVTFYPSDLEALLIAAYNRSGADMIGGRCNLGNGEDSTVERDEHGRVVENQCRDTNAGSFHVIMANYLGIMQRAYAEDKTYDYQVWNQPVVAYEVTKLEEITVQRANELLDLTGDSYSFNSDAVTLYYVEANTTYVTESHPSTSPANPGSHERRDYYTYILEVDQNGRIIGGEWTGRSRTAHPDFLWSPSPLTRSSVPNLDLENVRMLIRMSREPETPRADGDVMTYSGQGGIQIPDNNPSGVSSSLQVPDNVTIAGLQIELDIAHTYIADLRVTLSHNGAERVLHNNEGGSNDNIQRTINVSGFESMNARGTWTLKVVDGANLDVGIINGWRLRVTPSSGTNSSGSETNSNESFPGDGDISIPDDNDAGITSEAVVPNDVERGTVQVAVNITHTYIGDLVVTLTHEGQSWTLHDRQGGTADNINQTYPINDLTGSPVGVWTLKVVDHAGYDVGTLNSWSLNVSE